MKREGLNRAGGDGVGPPLAALLGASKIEVIFKNLEREKVLVEVEKYYFRKGLQKSRT